MGKKKYLSKYGQIEYPLIGELRGDSELKKQRWFDFLKESHLRICMKSREKKRGSIKMSLKFNGIRMNNTLKSPKSEVPEPSPCTRNEIGQLEKVWMQKFHKIREYPNERQCV